MHACMHVHAGMHARIHLATDCHAETDRQTQPIMDGRIHVYDTI